MIGTARRVVDRAGAARLAPMAVAATLGVLSATAYAIGMVPDSPERPAPVAVRPDVTATGTTASGAPEEQPDESVLAPRASVRSATRVAPAGPAPPSVSASPPATTTPSRPPELRARFAVETSALLSYGAAVTISNPGSDRVPDWALVIVLPRESLRVTSVSGARASQDGPTWTFLPDGSSGTVPGRGSVRVTFRVSGPAINATPTACTIDGAACTGLPD
ncbi:cellulose binding domain-containing protein [Micromonospora yasonensis]|uniref:cellulose binding domain-containing protein n=1 Tax=Micromonospora yasonensis TaxID=1128667 RepID=UPI0022313EF3|nr:cellulose binding domain-containing protein [Micromonospora yasonensis]MCW3841895.1 cellulose binding domain-containing protein [Micromonospora yasonensis]